MGQTLIDSGRSEIGWSHYSAFAKCLHYGALLNAGHRDTSDPLVKGTLLHVGLAHLHARWQAQQEKRDPEEFYFPEAAMAEWCRIHPEGQPFLGLITEVFRRYVARYPEPPGRILGVEMLIRAVLGTVNGKWGLWTLAQGTEGFNRSWRAGQYIPKSHLGGYIEPTTLDMPGHRNHGEPIMLTRRIDLAIQDRAGIVHVIDHKGTSGDTSRARARSYAMSGEFPATRTLCSQLWDGRFGQASLNLVQNVPPWSVGRHAVPFTPWRDARFAGMIHRLAHVIAQLQRDVPDPHDWPMAQVETVCVSRYGGECHFYEACMLGPAGLNG